MTTERFKEFKKNLCKEGFELSNQEFIEYERINQNNLVELVNSRIQTEALDSEEDLDEFYEEEIKYFHC